MQLSYVGGDYIEKMLKIVLKKQRRPSVLPIV